MECSASLRIEDDHGTRPNNPASVEGGQASHAPPINEPEQVAEGTMGILQQPAQALQKPGNQLQSLHNDQPLREWQGTDL